MFSLVGLLTSQSQAFVTPADISLSKGEINLYIEDTSAQLVATADHAKKQKQLSLKGMLTQIKKMASVSMNHMFLTTPGVDVEVFFL